MNKKIAKAIILAQVASDGGKKIDDIAEISLITWSAGYSAKDRLIKSAIKDILRSRGHSIFSFYVTNDDSIGSYLVYFNYRLNGERRQISFHTFGDYFWRFVTNNNTHHTRWDEGSSRANALELWNEIQRDGVINM